MRFAGLLGSVGVPGTVTVEKLGDTDGALDLVISGPPSGTDALRIRDRVVRALPVAGAFRVTLSPGGVGAAGFYDGSDLPIALALLKAVGRLPTDFDAGAVGNFRWPEGPATLVPPSGLISRVEVLYDPSMARPCFVPKDYDGTRYWYPRTIEARTLDDVTGFPQGRFTPPPGKPPSVVEPRGYPTLDSVDGNHRLKRIFVIAAAGGHHLALLYRQDAASMRLAMALTRLLPPMGEGLAREVSAAQSSAGLKPFGVRPFRAPHYTASLDTILGTGIAMRGGEVSLAHGGVLYLDNAPQFQVGTLAALAESVTSGKQPLYCGTVRVNQPADYQLVATLPSCPCGRYPAPDCTHTEGDAAKWRNRLHITLQDTIDLGWRIPHLPEEDSHPLYVHPYDSHESAAHAVKAAREAQGKRGKLNRTPGPVSLARFSPDAVTLFHREMAARSLPPVEGRKTVRVAHTIADLAGREKVIPLDVAEALLYHPTAVFIPPPRAAS